MDTAKKMIGPKQKGLIIKVTSTHYLVLGEDKKILCAHKSVNRKTYQLGAAVSYVAYLHKNVLSCSIKSSGPVAELLIELFDTSLEKYQSVRFEDIAKAGGLNAYCKAKNAKYLGPILIGEETQYLFKLMASR